MDTKERLQQCFEKLGYSSDFPKTLHINPSTNFVWQQILNNVKPRSEVEVIRKNIIINRLENKLSESQSVVQCPVPEIQIYNRLKAVKNDIESIRARIQEKQNKLSSLHNNRNGNYLIIKSIKQRNEEKRLKTHALKRKSEHQEDEIKQIQEMLNKKEISSISLEQSLSSDAVSKLLQCLIEETEKCSRLTRYRDSNKPEHSILSQPSILSSITRSSKACFSTVKKSQQRPNDMQRFVSCNNLNVARALFTENFKENNRNMKNCDISYSLDMSGDLLPESCFNFEADDEFLLSSQPTYTQKTLRSDLNTITKRGNTFGSTSNVYGQSNLNLEEQKQQKRDYVTQALLNKNIIREIENLYYGGNRDIIWSSICSLLANIKLELEKNVHMVNFRNRDICNDDLLPLNFIYIKNKLMCLKNKKQIKILKSAIGEKKLEIQKKLNGHYEAMEPYLDKIKLDGAINFLHREVFNDNTVDQQTTLKALKIKINKSKDELITKVKEIEDFIEIKDDLMERMKKCQDDTTSCVRKLSKYFFNPSWADALKENIHSKELEIFRKYPLHYKNQFFSDSIENVFLDESISDDNLYEVSTLLQHPQHRPEKIISDIIQKMYKAQVLSSMEFPEVSVEEKQHSLHEFQEKERYIGTFGENINALMHSSRVHEILKSSSHLRANMDLWLEVPFRRFISSKRVVDGKTYSEYEEAFDYIKNNN